MYIRSDSMPLPEKKNANAVPFAVAPRSSEGAIVGFLSTKPTELEAGSYRLSVYSYKDNSGTRERTEIEFDIELEEFEAVKLRNWTFMGGLLDVHGKPVNDIRLWGPPPPKEASSASEPREYPGTQLARTDGQGAVAQARR